MNKYALWFVMMLMALSSSSFGEMGYPIKNGDFFYYQPYGWPAGWNTMINTGTPAFIREEAADESPKYGMDVSNVRAVIKVKPGDAGTYWQDFFFLPGTARCEVEAFVDAGCKVVLNIAGNTAAFDGAGIDAVMSIDFTSSTSNRIHLTVSGEGQVKFKKVSVVMNHAESQPVAFTDNSVLGGIVIAEDASEPEKYAAYELQKYIYQMTGKTPGLRGRDAVAEGRYLVLGKACPAEISAKLSGKPDDSYLIEAGQDIYIAGNGSSGTLYGVYDFLKQQGCGWFAPDAWGEVVPRRKQLTIAEITRLEIPDYAIRGLYMTMQMFLPDGGGGWIYKDADAYADWMVKNRLNALWCTYDHTISLGRHRGTGHIQTVNHSWYLFLNDDHPEWWPLVDGKRLRLHISGRPNQLCISNRDLRDYAVGYITDYFKNNPDGKIFALNPEDEPAFWCECDNCRKLDPDSGQKPWVKSDQGRPEMSMANRVFDFANEITQRVTEIYPDKKIEVYGYGTYRNPPAFPVHANIVLKYTLWPNYPVNVSIGDMSVPANKKRQETLDAWIKQGVKEFNVYEYGDYIHPDVPLFSFNSIVDSLKCLKEKWNFRGALGETSNDVNVAFMWHNLRARALWNNRIDYQKEVNDICETLYGDVSGQMKNYYQAMDKALMEYRGAAVDNYDPFVYNEYDMAMLMNTARILDDATAQAVDELLKKRLAYVRYGHAMLSLVVAQQSNKLADDEDYQFAAAEYDLAKTLAKQYGITGTQWGAEQLRSFYLPPNIKKRLYNLPTEWQFKTDPDNKGQEEKWFAGTGEGWEKIMVTKDWTSQGYQYHGVAWYRVEFQMDVEQANVVDTYKAKGDLALFFGAVDGKCWIYLDGQKIAEQTVDPGFMWDKSFHIALPPDFNPTIKHILCLRVEKDSQAAGIWKPVLIVGQ